MMVYTSVEDRSGLRVRCHSFHRFVLRIVARIGKDNNVIWGATSIYGEIQIKELIYVKYIPG